MSHKEQENDGIEYCKNVIKPTRAKRDKTETRHDRDRNREDSKRDKKGRK
jgi:hypothetical protein